MQQLAIGVLGGWLVLLNAVAYPQLAAHAAQHAHHDASTHSTVLCSWLCMAANAAEATAVHLALVEQVEFVELECFGPQISPVLTVQPPPRAPPVA